MSIEPNETLPEIRAEDAGPSSDRADAHPQPVDSSPIGETGGGPTFRVTLIRALWLGAGGVGSAVGGLGVAAVFPGTIGLLAAAAGLVGLGVCAAAAARSTREPVRTLVGIGEALETYRGGELGLDAMRLVSAGRFGNGWNRLIADQSSARDDGRAATFDRRSRSSGGGGGSGLEGAVDALSQGLIVVDEHLCIAHVNGAAAVLIGVKRDEAIGRPLGGMDLPAEVIESVRQVVEGRRSRDATDLVRGEGPGRSVVRVSSRRVRRDDGGDALVLLEDVTQQRVAEESRHAMLAQAVHELRTPLTTIRLNVEMAIDAGDDTESRSTSLDVINQEARRLERVVNEMLSVSEMESGAFEVHADDIRLEVLFDELRSDYAASTSAKGIALEFELPPKWPVAKADREKLTVALHNLVGNAVKYTPSGGTVSVRVDADDTTLSVEVEDTGIGIAPEEQARVFERFYRSSDGRVAGITGSGIGLATAREIARRHGGDITLRSAIDQGSVFTLRVPIAESGGSGAAKGSGAGAAGEAPRARAA